ncbi:nuclear receptor domain-containing protein [Caerostris darwini]|uniref:Nuclear receptor domain-containing protein n=1 Tax=Caerostris darwini TaxID=1538125 RepID=A0AAV4V978_9ARAC|nr:nuclear receptor domain-containing protein [Caerostris darwini]
MAPLDMMNQLCKVCGEPAAGYHFGAFTCEGCKLEKSEYQAVHEKMKIHLIWKDIHKIWNIKSKDKLCLDETKIYSFENG